MMHTIQEEWRPVLLCATTKNAKQVKKRHFAVLVAGSRCCVCYSPLVLALAVAVLICSIHIAALMVFIDQDHHPAIFDPFGPNNAPHTYQSINSVYLKKC